MPPLKRVISGELLTEHSPRLLALCAASDWCVSRLQYLLSQQIISTPLDAKPTASAGNQAS